MAMASAHHDAALTGRSWTRVLLGMGATILAIVILLAVAALVWSGATLAGDSTALARVTVQPLGGKIEHVQAFGPDGRRVPIAVAGGRLTPLKRLKPGEQVSVDVQIRRPGWLGWALGSTRNEHLSLRAPVAQVKEPWLTVRPGSAVHVGFNMPISTVAYVSNGALHSHALGGGQSSVSIGTQAETGTTGVAVAARPWETVGKPTQVSWFPPSSSPVMVSLPAAGSKISPATHIHLTFSRPVHDVLGSGHPTISPATPGHWRETNSHTLVFVPTGLGASLGSQLHVQLPRSVAVTAGGQSGLHTTSQLEWTVPPGSTLRLQQLLAEAGYLP